MSIKSKVYIIICMIALSITEIIIGIRFYDNNLLLIAGAITLGCIKLILLNIILFLYGLDKLARALSIFIYLFITIFIIIWSCVGLIVLWRDSSLQKMLLASVIIRLVSSIRLVLQI